MIAEVTKLFERIVAELPPDSVTLTVDAAPFGTWLELIPANPSSAKIAVYVDDFESLNFSFGVISTWEFPYERRYRNGEKDTLVEVEEMSKAVIAGDCETNRGLFWLTGRIHVGDYTYEVTDLPMLPKRPFGTHRYQPYIMKRG